MQYFSTEFSTVFIYSLLSGVVLFLVYDVFLFFRICCIKSKIFCTAADILFMVTASLVTFIVSLAFNNGRVRLFICIGELTGFLVMLFTVGAVTKKLFAYILSKARKSVGYILNFFKKVITKPLKIMRGLLYNKNE